MEDVHHASAPAAVTSGREREDREFGGKLSKVGPERELGAHPASLEPPGRNAGSAPEKLSTEEEVQPRDPRRDVEPD